VRLPSPARRGHLVSRYKRFFADIRLEDGSEITAHCANPGAMLGLKQPGLPVWVTPAGNPKRRLQWDLQLVELPSGLVGVNTALPNRLVAEALAAGALAPLAAYRTVRPEMRYGEPAGWTSC